MRARTVIIIAVAAGLLGWAVVARLTGGDDAGRRRGKRGPAPVEVAPVERAPIELRRSFAGTLEARSRFVVAAHVGGRVERLLVDLADPVTRGQVVAELDDAEHAQTVAEAAAELAVARANLADADSGHEIAERERDRVTDLGKRGMVSDAEVDSARSRYLAEDTQRKVARAQVKRAEAALKRARIRSGYAKVVAAWDGDDEQRVVAERHADEGDMVAPNDPLFTVVDLAPLNAVVHVTEKEYARLEAGQPAAITTDAYPDRTFTGEIRRISPVFRETSRQARMELEVPNEDRVLKPGMFIRAEVVLARVEAATVVPFAAVTTRDGQTGVFVVDDAGATVAWRPVRVGIREGDRLQVEGEGIEGRVVTLGHQLIDDGSAIEIPEVPTSAESGDKS